MSYEEDFELEEISDDDLDDFFGSSSKSSKFKVIMLGFDAFENRTDFEVLFGTYATETAAREAIEEFYSDLPANVREEYRIPEDVCSIELRGFKAAEEDNIFSEDELFTVWPISLN